MIALRDGVEWTATNEGDYLQVLNGLRLPVRFEQWFAAKKARYPALTSGVLWAAAWLVTTVVAFLLGRHSAQTGP